MSKKLFKAISLGDTEEALRLLDESSVREAINDKHFGGTCLYKACEKQNVAVVKKILTVPGVDVRRGNGLKAPIHVACLQGNVEILRCLLQHDSSQVNLRDGGFSFWTPLHMASLCNHLDCVQLLVSEYNADTTARDRDGRTALDLAERFNNHEVATYLRKVTEGSVRENTELGKSEEDDDSILNFEDFFCPVRYVPALWSSVKCHDPFPKYAADTEVRKVYPDAIAGAVKPIIKEPVLNLMLTDRILKIEENGIEKCTMTYENEKRFMLKISIENMSGRLPIGLEKGMIEDVYEEQRNKVRGKKERDNVVFLEEAVAERERRVAMLERAVASRMAQNNKSKLGPFEKKKANTVKQLICKNVATLAENIDVFDHLEYLFSKDALDLSDIQHIRGQATSTDQMMTMLSILLSKPDPDAWVNHFMASLNKVERIPCVAKFFQDI